MMRLPNSERMIIDIRKIEEYCLNSEHPRGRHKARVFREVLGINQADASWFRQALLEAVRASEGIKLAADEYGSRWRVDVPIARLGTSVVVRTIWIIKAGEDVTRFVTCWVL